MESVATGFRHQNRIIEKGTFDGKRLLLPERVIFSARLRWANGCHAYLGGLKWVSGLRLGLKSKCVRMGSAILAAIALGITAGTVSVQAVACDVCLSAPAAKFVRWAPSEIGVAVRDRVANPYDAAQIEVRLRLRAPSGRLVEVPAFADPEGPTPFRVRWTPDEIGKWQATPQVRLGGAVWQSGPRTDWRVSEGTGRGFVRVDVRNSSMLQFDDGTPYFPIGANIAWYTNDALQEYRRRFDALAAAGGTATRVWLAPWSFLPEWNDTPLRNYANREMRMRWFDEILRMAEARGIYLIVVLSEAGMFEPSARWNENPYNAVNGGPCAEPHEFLSNPAARAAYANQLRYIAARWGYSPNILAWEWMNEVNSAPGFETERLLPWLREMSAVLAKHDAPRHLRTISYGSIAGDPRVWQMPEIEIVQRHEYVQGDPTWFRPLPAGQGRFRQVQQQPAKPVLLGEFGANSDMEHARGAYRQGIQMHNGLWASTFAGMAGAAMYWWWDNYLEPGRLWWRHSGLAEFLRGEDLGTMTPAAAAARTDSGPSAIALRLSTSAGAACARALVWVRNGSWQHDAALMRYVLDHSAGKAQAENFRYVAEPSRGVSVMLDGLPAGRYSIEVHDTSTGRLIRTFMAQSDGALRWIEPQIASDVAYKVRCATE